MSKFYFDDYSSVSSDDFEGKAILIDENQEHGLLFFHNGCKLPFEIDLRKKYYVSVKGEKHLVEHRFIVHTEKFVKEYKYDGKLGSFYYGDYSEFYVWAPTAYSLNVCLQDGSTYPMEYQDKGVYYGKVEKDIEGIGYLLEVEHTTKEKTIDPYAQSSTINSQFNYVVNPEKILKALPFLESKKRDAIVYEVNVRDFTGDPKYGFTYPGKFKSFTEKNVRDLKGNKIGYDYVKDLGVTHVQLLPIYDYGSIDESEHSREYNWGYDPVQYNVIEGKYSMNPTDPYERINEVVELVNTCKQDEIGVIMDVVYNHVYDKSQFSFEKLVPHYFFRYHYGKISDASFCGNEVASERYMVRRFMIDSLKYLTTTFGFAGYRFDLMGIHDIETMNEIEAELRAINPSIILYGEGWSLPTAIDRELCATQANATKVKNVGFFNDDFRNKCKQLITGTITTHLEEEVQRLLLAQDYENPMLSVQYVSCHDDYTLYDQLYYGLEEDNIIEKMKLAYTFVLLGQGFSFLHAGCEGGRTKYGIANSFSSSEAINFMKYDEMYENQELIQFTKELIRVRKENASFFVESESELLERVKVEVKDDLVKYSVDNMIYYINLSKEAKAIEVRGRLQSLDGYQKDENINNLTITTYAVVKGE